MGDFAPREHASDHAPVPSHHYHAPSPVYHTYADLAPPAVTHADPAPVLLPEPARPPLKLHPAAPAPPAVPIPSVYAPQAPLIIPPAYTQLQTLLARDPGAPLAPGILRHMEANLRVPLGDIRIHDDPGAWTLCAHLAAPAHTAGTHLFFAKGAYQPGTSQGRNLLGHQLQRAVAGRTAQQANEAAQPAAAPAHEALRQPAAATSVPAAAPQTQRVEDDRATIVSELTRLADQPGLGYDLLIALLGYDPIAARPVVRPADEVLAADILHLVPDGPQALAVLRAADGLARFVAIMTDPTHLGRALAPDLKATLSSAVTTFLNDPGGWTRARRGATWAHTDTPSREVGEFFLWEINPPLLTMQSAVRAAVPAALQAANAPAAPAPHQAAPPHGGTSTHPGTDTDAIVDVRAQLHWSAPAVQAAVVLDGQRVALVADNAAHPSRFALHTPGHAVQLDPSAASAVDFAMQDLIAAAGDAAALLPALYNVAKRNVEGIAKLPGELGALLDKEGA